MEIRAQSAGNLELAWLAGLWDGEGSFTLDKNPKGKHRNNYIPAAHMGMTCMVTMDRVSEILHAHGVGHYQQLRTYTHSGYKQIRYLRILGMKRILKFLDVVEPYLVTKAPAARILREFIDLRFSRPYNAPYGEQESALFEQLKSVHTRVGVPQRPHATHPFKYTIAPWTGEDMVQDDG